MSKHYIPSRQCKIILKPHPNCKILYPYWFLAGGPAQQKHIPVTTGFNRYILRNLVRLFVYRNQLKNLNKSGRQQSYAKHGYAQEIQWKCLKTPTIRMRLTLNRPIIFMHKKITIGPSTRKSLFMHYLCLLINNNLPRTQ